MVSLGILVMSGSAKAQLTQDSFLLRNARDLTEMCSAARTSTLYTAAMNFCHGFAVGVFRVLNEQGAAHPSERLFCLPATSPSRNQAIGEFVEWTQTQPALMNGPPADAIATFLAQRFPCPNRRPIRGASQ